MMHMTTGVFNKDDTIKRPFCLHDIVLNCMCLYM